jgi:hypothetical protein
MPTQRADDTPARALAARAHPGLSVDSGRLAVSSKATSWSVRRASIGRRARTGDRFRSGVFANFTGFLRTPAEPPGTRVPWTLVAVRGEGQIALLKHHLRAWPRHAHDTATRAREKPPMTMTSFALLVAGTLGLLVPVARPGSAVAAPKPAAADAALDRSLRELVGMPGGPPGAIALVQRGSSLRYTRSGWPRSASEGARGKATTCGSRAWPRRSAERSRCPWSTPGSSRSTIRSASASRASRSPGTR